MGDATGLSTVHVNRSIVELRKYGLIILERGGARCLILTAFSGGTVRFELCAPQERDVGHIRSRQDKSGSAMGGRSAVNSRPKKHVLFSLRRVMASSTNNIEDEVRRRA